MLLFSQLFLAACALPFVYLLESASLLAVYAAMVLLGVGHGLGTAARPAFVVGSFAAAQRGTGVGVATGLGALSGLVSNALVERAAVAAPGAMWQLGATMTMCLLVAAVVVALMRRPVQRDYCQVAGCLTSDSEHPQPSPSARPS